MTVPQIRRNVAAVFTAYITESRIDGKVSAVALGCTGNIDDGFRQDDPSFRPADKLNGLSRCIGDDQGLGIGKADVFSSTDDQAAGNKGRLLAGFDHAGQVMQGRIGIRTAHAFYKGRYRIVMGIAFLIIGIHLMTGYFFDGFLCQLPAGRNDHGNLFQQIKAYAGIAVSQAGNGSQHFVAAFNAEVSQSLHGIGQRPAQHRHDSLF